MIYGIEETTDLNHPETVVRKFESLTRARKWAEQSGGLAWGGAADESLPVTQQNWHHRFRDLYEMPPAFNLKLERQRENKRITREYFRPWEHQVKDSSLIRRFGKQISK